jgi:hypothetical protein
MFIVATFDIKIKGDQSKAASTRSTHRDRPLVFSVTSIGMWPDSCDCIPALAVRAMLRSPILARRYADRRSCGGEPCARPPLSAALGHSAPGSLGWPSSDFGAS